MSESPFTWRAVLARLLADDGQSYRRGLAAVAAVLVVVVAGVGGLVVSRRAAAPAELALPRATASTGLDGAAPDLAATGGAPTSSGPIVAHAAGAVVHPGVYRLTGGARVADLLTAAGGPAADADLDAVNLAAKVDDGQRVYVPHKGEVLSSAAAGGSDGPGAPAVVDLNSATLEQLDALPGVGPSTAQAILDYRHQHGRFRSVDQLLEVRGIGEAKLKQIRPRVRV